MFQLIKYDPCLLYFQPRTLGNLIASTFFLLIRNFK